MVARPGEDSRKNLPARARGHGGHGDPKNDFNLAGAGCEHRRCANVSLSVFLSAMKTVRGCRPGALLCLSLTAAVGARAQSAEAGWPAYGGDPGGTRYSQASQITRDNVAQLKVAWTFRTGAAGMETPLARKAAFEATPVLVDGKLY